MSWTKEIVTLCGQYSRKLGGEGGPMGHACRQLAKDGGRGRGNLLHLTDLFFMWPLYFTFMMALARTRYL